MARKRKKIPRKSSASSWAHRLVLYGYKTKYVTKEERRKRTAAARKKRLQNLRKKR